MSNSIQSKMTENEFRAAVDQSVARQQGKGLGWSYGQAAVEAARQAGLEFRPAPITLPDRLTSGPEARAAEPGPGFYPALQPEVGWWKNRDQEIASYAAAAARYNAYPGLREKAEVVTNCVTSISTTDYGLARAVAALRVELEKGPKS